MQPSPARPAPRAFTMALLVAALSVGACGKKPSPKADTQSGRTASAPRVKPDPVEPPEQVTRTLGGIELAPLVAGLEKAEAITASAMTLAEDRQKGVAGLIAAGPEAARVVIALLSSKSIDEVTAALEVLGADGDPTQGRPQAAEPVLALLSHEVAVIRDRAWALAPSVADGEALLVLLDRIEDTRKASVVRLLENWDSATIRNTLATLTRGPDAELAREAAFALTTPARPPSPEALTLTAELLALPAQRALGLTLARRLPLPLPPELLRTVNRVIDQALETAPGKADEDLALVLAATRATLVLPVDERVPLLEQLGRDGREDVRRVVAETLDASSDSLQTSGAHASLPRVFEVLDRLLADPEGSVRIAAIRARGALSIAPDFAPAAAAALAKKLQDGHRGVRLAAVVALSHPAYGHSARPLLDAQIAREDEPARALILEAMAASGSRPLIEAVISRLDGGVLVPVAHQALVAATGVDLPATQADWSAWLDQRYPPAPPNAEKDAVKDPAKPDAPAELKPGAAP